MWLGDGGKMQVRWIVGTYKRVGAFFLPKIWGKRHRVCVERMKK